jgi:hypothetical protein
MTSPGLQSFSIPSLAQELAMDTDLRELLFQIFKQLPNEVSVGSPPTKERIPDEPRLRRVSELVGGGMLKYAAARQACVESPAGASLNACERRVVRKYDRQLKRHRLP